MENEWGFAGVLLEIVELREVWMKVGDHFFDHSDFSNSFSKHRYLEHFKQRF
jgi:hypothetical protein